MLSVQQSKTQGVPSNRHPFFLRQILCPLDIPTFFANVKRDHLLTAFAWWPVVCQRLLCRCATGCEPDYG